MGTAKASELLLFNKKISAAEAFNRNLITEVIPDGSFAKETSNKVDNFAKLPREVTQSVYSKTCLKRPLKNRQNKDFNDKW